MGQQRNVSALDRVIGAVAPRWGVKRERARIALDMLRGVEPYEAASFGRRTRGWYRGGPTDANVGAIGLSRLRELARDLERNVDLASGVLDQLETDTVGTGILPTSSSPAFKAWSESTQCDADGRNDLAGLQKLVTRAAWRDGEVLVRRRWRADWREAGLALPIQMQVLEADYLDTMREADTPNGGRIVQGVEFDRLNQRVAYWLFREHPGSTHGAVSGLGTGSVRVPASEVLHIFRGKRAGQVRGASPFAAAIARFQNFETLDDATLTKQLVAACLAVMVTDVEGSGAALGTGVTTAGGTNLDELYPGMVGYTAPGKDVKVVEPPRVNEFGPYSKTVLRRLARAFGMTYEDFTGDYSEVNFSSGRLGRLGYQARSESWRWHVLVLQFLGPVWAWGREAAIVAGAADPGETTWTAPGWPMLEPDKEGLAAQRNIRSGITTLSEEIRARGYDPPKFLRQMRDDFKLLDELGLILDCDPRKVTQQGMIQLSTEPPKPKDANATTPPAKETDGAPAKETEGGKPPKPPTDDEDDEDDDEETDE